jgi:two-component system sensor histidine kinase KdpD
VSTSESISSYRILWHGDRTWPETNAVDALLHELRAPLGASSYALDVIRRMWDEDGSPGAEADRMLRTARLGVIEAQALIRWFYRVRTLAHGQLEPELDAVSVPDIVDRALALLPEARVRVTIANDVPPVQADPLWLTQTLTNLIENATKHTPESSVAQIFVRQFSPDRVVISVTDNGTGIPLELQRDIFRPAPKTHAGELFTESDSDENVGHGLGLSITHYFVRAMGGRIWVESDGRTGTTVRFTLGVASRSGSAHDEGDTQ